MTKLFKPLFSLWRTWKKTGNLNVAYHLLPEVFSPDIQTSVRKKGDAVELTAYQKKFSGKQIALFGKHGELLLKYIKAGSVAFEEFNRGNEVLSVNMNGKKIRLNVFNYDNLKVIEEIFIDQLYDFHAQEKYVVCDVGMNVAVSVLYFASFDNVEKVYGYEPFLQTYKRASENIDLNEGLKEKMETFNYGLGNTDEWLEVPLPEDGFLGGSTTKDFIDELPAELKKNSVKVEIKNICNEIQKIKQSHPEQSILLKLDCEGAEYDILQVLEKKNMINDIAVYMIEFHYKGKKELVNTLQRNNFFILSPVSDEVNAFGMLYAIKLKT